MINQETATKFHDQRVNLGRNVAPWHSQTGIRPTGATGLDIEEVESVFPYH